MKIIRVAIENYRSICKLELKALQDLVVFYGPNGGGKTNILRAIGCAFGLLRGMARDNASSDQVNPGWLSDVFTTADLRIKTTTCTLDVTVALDREDVRLLAAPLPQLRQLRFSCTVEDIGAGSLQVRAPVLRFLTENQTALDITPLKPGALQRFLVDTIGSHTFHRVDDVRGFSILTEQGARQGRTDIPSLLAAGRIEEAISRAATSSDDRLRERFLLLQETLRRPPLRLPTIEAVVPDGQYRLRVRTDEAGHSTVASDAASLGVQQIIVVLGSILFGTARCVAVEEPEAHLHAPTSGRALREVLQRLVAEGHVQQLFVATHSNLFDLDTQGFWSIQRDPGDDTTTAHYQTDLSRIDQDHLFEPGAAKRVLQDILRFETPEKVVAHGASGPITAARMLQELQDDTETGVRFAQDLSRATARQFIRSVPTISSDT